MKKTICILSIVVLCVALTVTAVILVPHLYVDMYALDGKTTSVWMFDVDEKKDEGWYENPVTTVYYPDGKNEIIASAKVDEFVDKGWYEKPVTVMYNSCGMKEVVYTADVPTKTLNGWYSEPVALMYKDKEEQYVLETEMETFRNDGWNFKEYNRGLFPLSESIKDYVSKKSGKYGIYIKNLNTGDFLILNDGQYSTASIIKLFVMAGIYAELENGNLKRNDAINKYLKAMITVSDNLSSNQLVRYLGNGDYRKGFETENAHTLSAGCINTQHKSLFIGCGYYTSYGYNRVSPYDCGIILEKIYNRTLVSPEYSDEMLSLLKGQQRRNKIPYLLPKDTVCANKTGETATVQSDVGIVFSPNCDYIICVLTNRSPTGIGDIREISRMTYEYFNN